MPRVCGDCGKEIEPIVLPYMTPDGSSGWFLVCPRCHYVFSKLNRSWFAMSPREHLDDEDGE